jgi:hypothetical protein
MKDEKTRQDASRLDRLVLSIFFDAHHSTHNQSRSRFFFFSPLYAIPLETVQGVKEDRNHPDKHSVTISPRVNTNLARENLVTILLSTEPPANTRRTTRKHAYQFTFNVSDDKGVAKRFLDLVNFVGKTAGGQVVTASVMKAQHVGEKAEKQQPAKKGSDSY